jgi:predicted RNA-binding protein with PUA-like domain
MRPSLLKNLSIRKNNSDEVTSDQPIVKRLRNSHPDDTQIESPPSVPITSEQKSSLSVSINSEDSLPDMPTLSQAKNSVEWESLWKPAIEKEMKNLDDNGTGEEIQQFIPRN